MGAPVILCGRTEAIGSGVIAGLQPEYDGSYDKPHYAISQAKFVELMLSLNSHTIYHVT
jgi:hypothetical protein